MASRGPQRKFQLSTVGRGDIYRYNPRVAQAFFKYVVHIGLTGTELGCQGFRFFGVSAYKSDQLGAFRIAEAGQDGALGDVA